MATYASRVVENVTVQPSPQWLQNLLMNAGIRPINNVVDVTNYVLLYFGQPMHAFDLDKFEDSRIVARDAREGEKLVTLDGEERELTTEDIVITVADKPVALAGVMGGASTEIDNNSKTLFLKLLFLMENQFVRQVAVSTFVQNHHHVLKKVSIMILSLKPLILLQLCCKNWQMERFLQAVFKRDLLIQSQSKFLQALTT